jgi:hypothetical protein
MTGKPPASSPSNARSRPSRAERLAETLRANLKRRKDAARSRADREGHSDIAPEHKERDE